MKQTPQALDPPVQPSSLETLIELAGILGQQTDFQEILRFVTSKALAIFGADITSIVMLNPRTQDTVKTIAREGKGVEEKRLHLVQTNVIGWVIKHRGPFLSRDISTDERFAKDLFGGTSIHSVMCVPVRSGGIFSGNVLVMSRETSRTFDDVDLSVLEKFAAVCSPFLSNAQRLQEFFQPPIPDIALIGKYEALGLLGKSQKFKELLRAIDAAAKCDVRVFLEGESGTGKELVARAIHRLSARSQHSFVAIDCGAIPDNLIESELFGHVKGAFTGATQSRTGLMEEANHGTLFLDEISNLPQEMQVKLLRALQEGEVRAVGSNQAKKIDVRIIAASSGPAWKAVKAQTFREDLYYRLHVYPIEIPQLNERCDDIALLAHHFLKKFASQQGKEIESLSPSLIQYLQHRQWTGNVRELENFIERLVTIARADMVVLDHSILPQEFEKEFRMLTLAPSTTASKKPLQEILDEYEAQVLREALIEHRWNQSEAARTLGISERAMRYKMEKLGIVRNPRP